MNKKSFDLASKVDELLNSLPCQSCLPFPTVEVECENLEYAEMLLNPMAGAASEYGAIAQYIYHSNTIEEPNIAKIMLCIGLVEMRHLDSLQECISLLGGEPKYYNGNHNFFSTGNIGYGADVISKLQANLSGELGAIHDYKVIRDVICDMHVKELLTKIISDEEVHAHILTELIEEVSCNG